jgi:putative Mg2+ transporter-C (MgtC) family protein
MTEFDVLSLVSMKIFYAVLCGFFIGIERKINDSSAGFKTQILVCVGSVLFTLVPTIVLGKPDGDSLRIVAQIISGVGFLGAGAIMHSGAHHVTGLTTAAWIWFNAAVGIFIGVGHGPVSVFVTLTLVAVITLARKFEQKLLHRIFPKVSNNCHSETSVHKDHPDKAA